MNRLLSLIAALVVVAGLAIFSKPASAGSSCSGYLATNTCTYSQNLVDVGGLSGGMQLAGPVVNTPTQLGGEGGVYGVYGTTVIYVTSTYLNITSSAAAGGAVVMTSTPNIATTTVAGAPLPPGFMLVVGSTVASYGAVFQANGTLSGSQLYLGAASRTVNNKNTLTLILGPDGFWKEQSFTTGQ